MTAWRATRGQPPICRFAPSPTGLMHLGHAYSAVLAHDLARDGGGRFVVRIEDIDGGRCRPEFAAAIFRDLEWLGLDWDEVVIQSQRGPAYGAALDRLKAQALAYRCICTRAEVAASASAPQGTLPPVYPGTCRTRMLTSGDAAWRLDIAGAVALAGPLAWDDAVAGRVLAAPLPHGDVVVARKDALASYHLAVVVDDAAQGVTDVVRGRDLFAATHVHRLLQTLLDLPRPRYHHHPLVTGTDGKRLAKRAQSATLADLRAGGMDPASLVDGLRNRCLPIGFGFDSA